MIEKDVIGHLCRIYQNIMNYDWTVYIKIYWNISDRRNAVQSSLCGGGRKRVGSIFLALLYPLSFCSILSSLPISSHCSIFFSFLATSSLTISSHCCILSCCNLFCYILSLLYPLLLYPVLALSSLPISPRYSILS